MLNSSQLVIIFNQLTSFSLLLSTSRDRGKAIPLQAWTGPEGSRRLRFPDFKAFGTWRW